ncbi:MAG: type I-E CRISPR-associated protein Cas6/Cse3/CasE [Deltaproteobacteria bacterium]|nr:type I-E CRISPR-associated protein Cas6/Cse3/CasE [Deltaproteobacteria bacterium]
MYLSNLLIDVGTDPDRPRPGRLWLRNVYRVHQRLCMAFPKAEQKDADKQFLTPYNPNGFQVARDGEHNFLFRIDHVVSPDPRRSGGCAMILVQSPREPDWDYAFGLDRERTDLETGRPIGNAGHLLAAPPQVKSVNLRYDAGTKLHFKTKVNATRRVRGGPFDGKRVSIGRDPAAILAWLERKGAGSCGDGTGGFRIVFTKEKDKERPNADCDPEWDANWEIETGVQRASKGNTEEEREQLVHAWAAIDGILEVTAPDLFEQTLASGIGSAKAFGFGLLSVAPR